MQDTAEDPRVRAARTKRRRTREALLAAARCRFAELGWAGTRMEDVARDAGVAVATAYAHYSKQTLIGHVYVPIFQPLVDRARDDIAAGRDPVRAVVRHVGDLARLIQHHRNLTIALISAIQERALSTLPRARAGDAADVRTLVPAPEPLAQLIEYGQQLQRFTNAIPALDVATYHTNALFLRAASSPHAGAAVSTRLVLSQLLPALTVAAPPCGAGPASNCQRAPNPRSVGRTVR